MIRILWSFGNNQKRYLFGKDIEAYKKSMHNFAVFNIVDDTVKEYLGIEKSMPYLDTVTKRRLFVRSRIYERYGENKQLQQLHQLERLQQLELSGLSYEGVEIKPNSIVYCDPPYFGTAEYNNRFDFDRFYLWCEKAEFPLFISEYNLNIPGFKVVKCMRKQSMLKNKREKQKQVIEKLYANRLAVDILNT